MISLRGTEKKQAMTCVAQIHDLVPQPPHTVAAKMSVQMTGCRVKPSIERDLVLDYVVPNASKFVLVVTFNT